jgi:hypothetical protein
MEHVPPQRGAAMIRREPGGKHEPNPPSGSDEHQPAFKEQLKQVGVPISMKGVDT